MHPVVDNPMRLAQRLKKLEETVSRLRQIRFEAAPEIERTDEERADMIGGYLWIKVAVSKEYPPTYPGSGTYAPPDDFLRAWQTAAESAWQQGYRAYHVGLRPYAMAVWLEWKQDILKAERGHREWVRVHGEWVWDVPPRCHTLGVDDFRLLPLDQQVEVLCDSGEGHWAKDGKRKGRQS
jgi:hypothetical protein